MKITFAFIALSISSLAFSSDQLLKKCGRVAEKALETKVGENYDLDGFQANQCVLADNQAAVVCELSAFKGEGAALDTYLVVLNKTCKKTLRIELIGEE